jgi:hypothetical protein
LNHPFQVCLSHPFYLPGWQKILFYLAYISSTWGFHCDNFTDMYSVLWTKSPLLLYLLNPHHFFLTFFSNSMWWVSLCCLYTCVCVCVHVCVYKTPVFMLFIMWFGSYFMLSKNHVPVIQWVLYQLICGWRLTCNLLMLC